MWILAPKGFTDEGAYAVKDHEGQKVVFLFEERDDCERYGIQLEAKDLSLIHISEPTRPY